MGANRRSRAHLRRLVEDAVNAVCDLPRPGLWLCVDEVEPSGDPPDTLRVWATLHFLPEGSPFCCGESCCHLGLWGERLEAVGDHVRRAMGLRQKVTIELHDSVAANYDAGVECVHPWRHTMSTKRVRA